MDKESEIAYVGGVKGEHLGDLPQGDWRDLIVTFGESDAERVVKSRPGASGLSGEEIKAATDDLYKKTRKYDREKDIDSDYGKKIVGYGQKTGTDGYTEVSEEIAKKIAQKEDVEAVFINQGINKITGQKGKTNTRPDITVVRSGGKIDVIEIESKTDKTDNLKQRNDSTLKKLPEANRGENKVMSVKEANEILGRSNK